TRSAAGPVPGSGSRARLPVRFPPLGTARLRRGRSAARAQPAPPCHPLRLTGAASADARAGRRCAPSFPPPVCFAICTALPERPLALASQEVRSVLGARLLRPTVLSRNHVRHRLRLSRGSLRSSVAPTELRERPHVSSRCSGLRRPRDRAS